MPGFHGREPSVALACAALSLQQRAKALSLVVPRHTASFHGRSDGRRLSVRVGDEELHLTAALSRAS